MEGFLSLKTVHCNNWQEFVDKIEEGYQEAIKKTSLGVGKLTTLFQYIQKVQKTLKLQIKKDNGLMHSYEQRRYLY